MGGKIDGYLDCTSPYSYFALIYLRQQRELLKQYNVEVEFHPIFLGGINVASGNKPPWSLPAKAKYGPYDLKRAIKWFGTKKLQSAPFFPILSILPQRCMLYVKDNYTREQFERAFEFLWDYSFDPNYHIDISKPENMARCLAETLPKEDIPKILDAAKTPKYKDLLSAQTKKAVELGAFGAPFFWMTNDKGESEPLFGSDRWSYMFDFMGVEVSDLYIKDKRKESKL